MVFEEYSRQYPKVDIYSEQFDYWRNFARYNIGHLPIFYFERSLGIFLMKRREAEITELIFNRSLMYHSNELYIEIEFLGHAFGFPLVEQSFSELESNILQSIKLKERFFKECREIRKITDIDFSLNILNS